MKSPFRRGDLVKSIDNDCLPGDPVLLVEEDELGYGYLFVRCNKGMHFLDTHEVERDFKLVRREKEDKQ